MEPITDGVQQESSIMHVWPSISAFNTGRMLGRLYTLGPRFSLLGVPIRPGWLLTVPTLPLSVALYFAKIVPRIPFVLFGLSNPWCMRYRLSTERVVIEHPFDALSKSKKHRGEKQSCQLSAFDSIEVQQQPGQKWYRAADLVFLSAGQALFRLPAVPHAEAFRQACLKARQSSLGIAAVQNSAARV